MKLIRKPSLKNAHLLSAMEMNAIGFSKEHTILTPAILEQEIPPTSSST